jgi:plasmid stabilization system protein ParE
VTERVNWQPVAFADLTRVIRHIAEENPIAARRVGRELLLAADSLTIFPRRGRRGRIPGTRELVAVRPYIIVYELTEHDTVTILRVWHEAQNPAE